ncbi:AAA family ATPase [Plantibacter sp. VKM Ac-2885]|uniref:AAA family ATPase n=1 Tax=Plantibacter sp. VKM Ac-2885 TaxID=2783828 RepID=UPI00351CB6B4
MATVNNDDWPEPPSAVKAYAEALGARRTGSNQWAAHCPNPDHPDENESFGFRARKKLPVVWNCLGCDDSEGVRRGLKATGLSTRRLRRLPASNTFKLPSVKRSAEREPYSNQDKPYEWSQQLTQSDHSSIKRHRNLLAERAIRRETWERVHVGTDGRSLTIPQRASGGGPWLQIKFITYPEDGSSKVVNQSPGSVSMIWPQEFLSDHPTLPVLLCEGEWDALLANQESEGLYVAVTGTGGAQTPPRDLSPLSGREVFVAYDADEAGRAGAEKVATRLNQAGARARVLDLTRLGVSPDSKEDVTDFFVKYAGTAERLASEMERLRSQTRERFKTVSAAELAEAVPPMRWLVKGVWPEGSYGVLAGEKKTLKTYNGLAFALAVASGEPFLGEFEVPKPRSVLMYLGEGGKGPTQHRLQRIAKTMGVDLAALPLRMVFDAGDLTSEEFLTAFDVAVREDSPGLVIVDPLYAYHPPEIEAQNLYARGAMLAGDAADGPGRVRVPDCRPLPQDRQRRS